MYVLAGGMTFISFAFNELFDTTKGSDFNICKSVVFGVNQPATMFRGFTPKRSGNSQQNSSTFSRGSSLNLTSGNPFRKIDNQPDSQKNENAYTLRNADTYSKKKPSASEPTVNNDGLYTASYGSHSRRTETQSLTIGSALPPELYSTNEQRQGVTSSSGNNNEDPFEEGGGTDPNHGYNDVPIGDANWFLMLLIAAYALIKYKSPVGKWVAGLKSL